MGAGERLSRDRFAAVVESTPLVSIDFVICNAMGEFLAGLRRNEPAKGCWFVPGGRIRKDETIVRAIDRILGAEVGSSPGEAEFLGVFEHFYPTNALDLPTVTTHYVVLAFLIRALPGWSPRPDSQHEQFTWFVPSVALAEALMHENTKAYARLLLGERTDRRHGL